MKIPVSDVLKEFSVMLSEHWAYRWGSAQKGLVDCAGAFVYVWRQHGLSLYQGSNYIARNATQGLLPINAAKPGMMAFKARAPDEKGYALPDKYKPGGARYNGDLRDYHHIGLVSADGKSVLNAQSTQTGFVSTPLTAAKGWDAVAYAKDIDYGGGVETPAEKEGITMQTMTVVADSGSTVNLRTRPDSGAKLLGRIQVGTQVQVLTISGGWATVQHDGLTGYMMDKYLASSETEAKTLEERVAKLEERVAALEGGKG